MLLALAPSARAQLTIDPTLERGLKPYGSFEGGDIDSISMTNGNLNLHLPLISYPQRGGKLSLSFSLKFDNNSYSYSSSNQTGCTTKPFVCVYGTAVNGPYMEIVPNLGLTAYVSGVIPPTNGPYATLESPDGSQHEMGPVSGGGWRSIDATGYLCLSNCATIIDRDGIRYTNLNAAGQATRFEDPNGNYITAALNSKGVITSYTDTLGRVVPAPPGTSTSTQGCTGLPAVAAYDWNLPGYQGGNYTLKICYADIYFGEEICRKSGGAPVCGVTLQETAVIDSIVLPNNTAWTFTYDTSVPNGPAATGNLLQITFPTGGYIAYTWAPHYYCQKSGVTSGTTYTYTVASRTVNANDGTGAHTWQYSFGDEPLQTTSFSTSSTDPLNQKTAYTITAEGGECAYYVTLAQTSNSAGTVLKTVKTDYEAFGDPMTLGSAPTTAADVVPTAVTTTWPNNQVSKIVTGYDAGVALTAPVSSFKVLYGLPSTKSEYDFGTGAPGALIRTTTTAYMALNNSSYLGYNLLTLPYSVIVSGSNMSTTSYGYDVGSLSPSSVSEQHDPSPANGAYRGNQTSVNRFLTGSAVSTTSCPVSVTNGSLTTNISFYDTGMPAQAIDPCLKKTTFGYSGSFFGAYLTQTTFPATANGVAHITTKNYDSNTGLLASSVDENGNPTNFTYDGMWRLATVRYPDGGLSTVTRQESTFPFSATLTLAITPSVNYVHTNTFDGLGRVSNTQVTSDPEGTVNTSTVYDSLGRVKSVTNPYRQTSDPTYGVTSYVYDALGRTCVLIPPDGTAVASGICPSTRPANDIFTTYAGGTTTVTDEAGTSRKSVADGLGRVIQVFEDPSGLDYETDYQYDGLNNLLTVSQKGGSTTSSNWRPRTFAYDSLSQLTSATNPESGTLAYSYDANGNMIKKTDARAINTTYTYDALNRNTEKDFSDGTLSAYFIYDVAIGWGGPFTNVVGRLTEAYIDDPNLTAGLVYSYDVMGRVVMNNQCDPTDCPPGTGFGVFYTYNLAGGLTSASESAAQVTYSYAYDGAGRATALTSNVVDAQHPATLATVNKYFPSGQIQQLTYGNGLTETNMFNSRLQPCRFNVNASSITLNTCSDSVPSGNIQDLNYAYNLGSSNNGNVMNATGTGTQAFSRTYAYDSLNRLSSMTGPGGTCTGLTFSYDGWGNRLTQTETAGTFCNHSSLAYSPNNQIMTSGYTYDAAGNLTYDGVHHYFYDAESRVSQVDGTANCVGSTACYFYDALGRRVQKTVGGIETDYLYDTSGNVVTEFNNDCQTMCWSVGYAYLNGEIVAQYSASTTFFVHQDHLGSSHILTDVAGDSTPADCNAFYPFGEQDPSICASSNATTHKFTAKERDSESDLDNFGARYDSSSMGRFTSPDPLLNSGRPWEPQSWNRYAYALNNPLNVIDPTGLYDLVNNCASDDKKCNKQFNQHASDLKNGLSDLQKKVDKMKDGTAKDRLEASLNVLGTQGDNNGVNVNFGSLDPGVAGQTNLDMSSNSLQINSINITLDPSKINSSNDYAIAFAHEGTHAEDFLTMGLSASSAFSVPDLSSFSTEYRGYQTSAWAAQALGVSPLQYNDSNGMNVIWNSSWKAADRQVLMDRGITNHVSSIPGHPETTPHNPWPF